MDTETDASNGGESLTLDQAAARLVKATSEPVSDDHGEDVEHDENEHTTDEDLPVEGDETDGEPQTEEDPAEGVDDEPESEQGRFVADNAKVRLADGTVTTIHELKRGFLREGDYTRKTTETAEQRKQLEGQSAALKASQDEHTQQRQLVAQLLHHIVGDPPPISMLDPNSADFDMVGYHQRKANHDAWKQHLDALQQQDAQSRQQKTEESAKSERETADKEWNALLQVKGYEHLKDGTKAATFATNIGSYLTGPKYGFTQSEMKAVALDHRFAVIADKARRWDSLQDSKATVTKKVEGRPPVQRGGKRLSSQESQARTVSDATAKLRDTGRFDDGVRALIALQQRK